MAFRIGPGGLFPTVLTAAVMALAGPTLAQSCDPDSVALATTPSPPTTAANVRVHRLNLEAIGPDKNAVVVGDSLALRWPSGGLREVLPGIEPLNFGLSGDTTYGTLWRLQDENLRIVSPSTVVLLVGSNNMASRQPNCAILAGVEAILEQIDSLWSGFRLYVIAVPPRGVGFTVFEETRIELNKGLATIVAGRNDTFFVDVTAELTCDRPPLTWVEQALVNIWRPTPGCPLYMDDWIHLTGPAYDVINARILQIERDFPRYEPE